MEARQKYSWEKRRSETHSFFWTDGLLEQQSIVFKRLLYFREEAFTALTGLGITKNLEKADNPVKLGVVLLVIAIIFGIDQFFVSLIRNQ